VDLFPARRDNDQWCSCWNTTFSSSPKDCSNTNILTKYKTNESTPVSSDQAAVPAPSFNPVLKLIFWMRCHGPIVNRVKIRGHIPPMVGWEQKMSTKAGRGGGGKGRTTPFLFGEGWVKKKCITSGKPLTFFFRTTRQWSMVFLLKYYFSFSPEDCSNTNFYLFLRKK